MGQTQDNVCSCRLIAFNSMLATMWMIFQKSNVFFMDLELRSANISPNGCRIKLSFENEETTNLHRQFWTALPLFYHLNRSIYVYDMYTFCVLCWWQLFFFSRLSFKHSNSRRAMNTFILLIKILQLISARFFPSFSHWKCSVCRGTKTIVRVCANA